MPRPVRDGFVWMIAAFPAVAALVDAVGERLVGDSGALLLKAVLVGVEVVLVGIDVHLVKAAGLKGPGMVWGLAFDPVYVFRRRALSGRSQLPFCLALLALGLAVVGSTYASFDESRRSMDAFQTLDSMHLN